MSYNYNYNPKVVHPDLRNDITPMKSIANQTPFFFGGSQVPTDLYLDKNKYSGSSGSGFHRGKPTHIPSDFDRALGQKSINMFHRKGHNIKIPHTLPHIL